MRRAADSVALSLMRNPAAPSKWFQIASFHIDPERNPPSAEANPSLL
jgi:hypothetical protein